MSSLQVFSFEPHHLDGAAELLAARQRRDRARDPRLPAEFEEAAACRPRIEALLPSSTGVAATRDGRLAGYLIARMAPMHEPHRRAFVPLEGHAVVPEEDGETYRQMYAALGPELIRRGLFDHQVHVAAADAEASDALFSLTFGQGFHVASRSLDSVEPRGTTFEVRLAEPGDLAEVERLVLGLFRQGAESPSFLPYLFDEETTRAEVGRNLQKVEVACWLAVEKGRPTGFAYLGRPWEPGMDRTAELAHVFEAFVDREARGRGVGTALLAHCVAWARENGYQGLSLDYRSYNVVGARFWLGHGFGPVSTILQRRLDPRLAWADGTNQ